MPSEQPALIICHLFSARLKPPAASRRALTIAASSLPCELFRPLAAQWKASDAQLGDNDPSEGEKDRGELINSTESSLNQWRRLLASSDARLEYHSVIYPLDSRLDSLCSTLDWILYARLAT